MKKINIILIKILYSLYYMVILIFIKIRKDDYTNSNISEKFIEFNNKRVMRIIKKKKINSNEIALLLPHCLQAYDYPFKITTDIENCKECGKCVIDKIVKLKKNYGVNIKVATGGALARLF